jgi:hypothetical protein
MLDSIPAWPAPVLDALAAFDQAANFELISSRSARHQAETWALKVDVKLVLPLLESDDERLKLLRLATALLVRPWAVRRAA